MADGYEVSVGRFVADLIIELGPQGQVANVYTNEMLNVYVVDVDRSVDEGQVLVTGKVKYLPYRDLPEDTRAALKRYKEEQR